MKVFDLTPEGQALRRVMLAAADTIIEGAESIGDLNLVAILEDAKDRWSQSIDIPELRPITISLATLNKELWK